VRAGATPDATTSRFDINEVARAVKALDGKR